MSTVATEELTYWNGERCECERATVIVADADFTQYWARPFVGQQRKVVLVHYNGTTFAIDDEGYSMTEEQVEALRQARPDFPDSFYSREHGYEGWGWYKVTRGRGGPSHPHASISYERILETEHDGAV